MSLLDASRFLANFHTLFAPNLYDEQEFTAYIDGESNSLVILGENILYPSSGNFHIGELSYELKNTSTKIKELQDKADYVENLCTSIPGFVTKIENISGSSEGLPVFAFDTLYFGIADLRNNLYALEDKINSIETLVYSKNNDATASTKDETIASLQYKLEQLQFTVDELAAELHSKVVSENHFNLSD